MSYKNYFILLSSILLALITLSFFLPLLSYQEARRIVIVQEGFLRLSLIPTFNGEPYFTKPPLYTWISLPFFAIGYPWGGEIFTMRLISILCYVGVSYLLYLILKKDIRKTLLTLLILLSSFRFFSFLFRIDLEPLFIFFTTLNFYFLLKHRENPIPFNSYLFYISFTLAFLVRGPLHFFLIPALLFLAITLRDKGLLRLLYFLPGWAIFIILITPWFLYGYLVYGKEVFSHLLQTDLAERLTAKGDPFYYYIKAFVLNFAPYLFLTLYGFRSLKKVFRETEVEGKIYLGSFTIPIILLSFTGEKFDKYLLFLYPLASLFFANILLKLYNERILFGLGLIMVLLNFIFISGIHLHQRGEINFKMSLWKKNLLPKENYHFFKEVPSFALYLLKKPCPIIREEDSIKELKRGSFLISSSEIKDLTPKLVLPDPYKKGKFWYVYER
ncbi:MAG: glycosyltransferase family 39 protein [Caldimicrobium sp.]|nr:glycosyltransferase family 39 protein [Caldimicrobium sp.]MDW8181992.1 glycosyltransferase family 39 protein [Caldimicrobium sp.]